MATMVAYTTLELTKEQKSALCAAVEKGASEAFNIDISITELMLMPTITPQCHSPSAKGQIIYFVYTAPTKTDDQKRQLVKNLYDATLNVVGPLEKNKVVVIIKEHINNNVGVDSIRKSDM